MVIHLPEAPRLMWPTVDVQTSYLVPDGRMRGEDRFWITVDGAAPQAVRPRPDRAR